MILIETKVDNVYENVQPYDILERNIIPACKAFRLVIL